MTALLASPPAPAHPNDATALAAVPRIHADRIKASAQEFEAVFLSNMLEEMFAGLGDEGPFGGGAGSAIWRSLRCEEFARAIAAAGGIGLADHVQRELLALQEQRS